MEEIKMIISTNEGEQEFAKGSSALLNLLGYLGDYALYGKSCNFKISKKARYTSEGDFLDITITMLDELSLSKDLKYIYKNVKTDSGRFNSHYLKMTLFDDKI